MNELLDPFSAEGVCERLAAVDWRQLADNLNTVGAGTIDQLLYPEECRRLAALYEMETLYRSRIVMQKFNFGRGEYKYFNYPLPGLVAGLRTHVYPHLAQVANNWNEVMGLDQRFPQQHAAYLRICHAAGQLRPTPLMLQYKTGDYNCLHQDVYGEHSFPLQMVILLSEPGQDFTGGELILTEQRPRMQSRAEVIALRQGAAVVFPVRYRPVQGGRRPYRVIHRHGVSRIHSGQRHTLGLIFHDAT
jgi:hypothetical protein